MIRVSNTCFLLGIFLLLFSCTAPQKQADHSKKKAVQTELAAPFKKHLKIEIGPEIIFDVFSWGRGSDSSSSLLILRSDSLKNDFTVASTDNLDGHLEEVFNTDMDKDGNPEVVVYFTKNDKSRTADVFCYEFNGKNVNKITFPDLTSKTQKQYRGNDKFYVKGGELYREFNVFADADSTSKPSGEKLLKYFLKGNKFDLTEME